VSKGIFHFLVGGLMALLLFTLGCGSGNSTTSLTRGEFIKQGNAICEKQQNKRKEMIGEAVAEIPKGQVMSDKLKKRVMLEITPFYEKMTAELKQLGTPEGDEQQVEAMIKAMEKAPKETRAHLSRAINRSVEYTKPDELVRDYGLESCAI
jgi:hypothetical protein